MGKWILFSLYILVVIILIVIFADKLFPPGPSKRKKRKVEIRYKRYKQ